MVKWTGAVLLLVGLAGFLTVADDLRHTGELVGVGGVVCAALCMLVASTDNPVTRRAALQWVAVSIGVGEVAEAALDNMLVGVGGGVVVGWFIAVMLVPTRGCVTDDDVVR